MKSILFILLLIYNFNICLSQSAPKCITTENVYQGEASGKFNRNQNPEWWYLQQLYGKSGGAIYSDSFLSKDKIIAESYNYYTKNLKVPNPVTETFKQSLDKTNNYYSITYNNEPSDSDKLTFTSRSDPGGGAHAKGFFIWNQYGGIHVIHSYPESPIYEDLVKDEFQFFKETLRDLAQHSLCISLKPDQLDIIPKLLIYGDYIINTINGISIRHYSNKLSRIGVKDFKNIATTVATRSGYNPIDIEKFKDSTGAFIDLRKEAKTFTNFESSIFKAMLFGNTHWSKKIELRKWSDIASNITNKKFTSDTSNTYNCNNYDMIMDLNNDGESLYFVQASNSPLYENGKRYKATRQFPVIWEFIADYYTKKNFNKKWYINTHHHTGRDGNNKIPYPSPNIQVVIRTDSPRTKSEHATPGREHSKLAYYVDNKDGIFCVGDLNLQGKQGSRGGSSLCLKGLGYLAEYYERRVGLLGKPPPKPTNMNNYKLFGKDTTPHSAAGIKIDFSDFYAKVDEILIDVNSKPTMEFFINDNTNLIQFNPRLYIDTKVERLDVTYEADGSIKYGTSGIALHGTIDEIYVPTKIIPSTPPTTPNGDYKFDSIDNLVLIMYPSIKDEIILCDTSNKLCSYDYIKYKVIDNIKLSFTFDDITEEDDMYSPTKIEKGNYSFLKVLKERDDLITLVHNIKSIFQYFGIQKKSIRFIKGSFKPIYVSELVDTDDCIETIGSNIIVSYDLECFDYLIFCINSNAVKNKISFNNLSGKEFKDKINNLYGDKSIPWKNTPSSCVLNIKRNKQTNPSLDNKKNPLVQLPSNPPNPTNPPNPSNP